MTRTEWADTMACVGGAAVVDDEAFVVGEPAAEGLALDEPHPPIAAAIATTPSPVAIFEMPNRDFIAPPGAMAPAIVRERD